MRVELVVFDMAGTTVHDGDAVHCCLQAALGNAGVQATRDEVNRVMGIAKPIAIRSLLELHGRDASKERVEQIHADFLDRMMTYYRTAPEVREVPGAGETFRRLRAAGTKVALDTGFSRPIADVIIERTGWLRDGLIDAAVTSDEVAQGRPHPDLIFEAMARTGVHEVSRVAKVGDTPVDLQEGTAAGCGWVIGVTEGSHTREQLDVEPHTHLIQTVADLPELLLTEERGHD